MEEVALGQRPQHVVVDELEDLLLLRVLLETGVLDVGVDHDEVLLALALEGLQLVILVGGHVFEQQLPGRGSQC